MVTLGALLRDLCTALTAEGIDGARFEAQQIIRHITGFDSLRLLTEPQAEVSSAQESAARELVRRRLNGEPLQYLLGEWEFYGFPFKVGQGVLIPRQDTETLVEIAQKHTDSSMRCADLCAGSGCIGIALARLCGCRVDSYELSDKAIGYLSENVRLNGVDGPVTPVQADILRDETVEQAPMYDVIVTNPPYLTAKDMDCLQKEVTHEPRMALFGGEDGLMFYREILAKWTARLKTNGFIAAEIGIGQQDDVMRIFRENGVEPSAAKDGCGIYRVVYGNKL